MPPPLGPVNTSVATQERSIEPAASTSGPYVVFAWGSFHSPGEIKYRISNDSGDAYQQTLNLSNDSADSCCPSVATFGSNVYIVWKNTYNTTNSVTSPSNTSPSAIIPPSTNSSTITNSDIYFRRSIDGGHNFEPVKILSTNYTADSTEPKIATSGDKVYVVWTATANGNKSDNADIYMVNSTDGGLTFSTPANLSKNRGLSSVNPDITIAGNEAYVVWSTGLEDRRDIVFKKIYENGTMTNSIDITNNMTLAASNPVVSISYLVSNVSNIIPTSLKHNQFNNNQKDKVNYVSFKPSIKKEIANLIPQSTKSVKIAWEQKSQFGNTHVFYTMSINDGNTFSKSKDISPQPPSSGGPELTSSGNTDYLAFMNIGPEPHPAARMIKFRDNIPIGEAILNQNDTNLASGIALAVSSPEKAIVGITRYDPKTGQENIGAVSCSRDQCSKLQNITGPSPYNATGLSENLTLTAPLPTNATIQPIMNNTVPGAVTTTTPPSTTTTTTTTPPPTTTTTTNRVPTALDQYVTTFENMPLDIKLTAKDPDKMDKFTFPSRFKSNKRRHYHKFQK